MPDYMNDTNAVLQNLKDAGCDDEVVKTFMELAETGRNRSSTGSWKNTEGICWTKSITERDK